MSEQAIQVDQNLPPALLEEVTAQSSRVVPPQIMEFVEELKVRYGQSLDAVILYGSCLHSHKPDEGIVDFYAIVDDYRHAYMKRWLRLFNVWLPPNVFYMEIEVEDSRLRSKYAVISMPDFERGCRKWFHSYVWARFAQPARIVYMRDEKTGQRINRSLTAAVVTFLEASVPVLGSCVTDAEEIWTRSLTLAYAAELRPEQKDQARRITHLSLGDFVRLTTNAAPALHGMLEALPGGRFRCRINKSENRRARRNWRLRRWQGRFLSILRLTKAVFTFSNSVEYAAWKIERHTGVSIEVTPRMQRHPILSGFSVLWQLLRRGVIR